MSSPEYTVGIGKQHGKRLSEYIAGQNVKACASRAPDSPADRPLRKPIRVTHIAEIVEPFAVFLY
jgi:hypothetical protein